jgi:uncharacterized protein YbjT (DUF2867 family)
MKIVVIGGSGLIGSQLVDKLRNLGHEVIAASPQTGVNTMTGEGLSKALAYAGVVVDVSNSPSFEDDAIMEFFEISGRNLVAAELIAGVKHHIVLSIVGTEHLQDSAYFRGKLAQERLIRNSGIPYTIVHSTQFYEFLGGIAAISTEGDMVRISPARIQPIAAAEVAGELALIAINEPINGIVEIAGPDSFSLSELVRLYLNKTDDPRKVIADEDALYYGTILKEKSLMPGDGARLGIMDFESWYVNQPKR